MVSLISQIFSVVFGILLLGMGFVNTFWGNDTLFGIGVFVLGLLYFPPIQSRAERFVGIKFPVIVKAMLGLFALWACLGVGELFVKINLMLEDLK